MSFNDRFWDDEGFGIADSDELIPSVVVLLGRLRLTSASHGDQVAGIRSWLKDHNASTTLLRSIEDRGYAEALTAEQHPGGRFDVLG